MIINSISVTIKADIDQVTQCYRQSYNNQMSREEIDKILNTDIDSHLTQHLHTIDHITDQLAIKSNFLAQFQLLLQQEISQTHTTQQQQQQQGNVQSETIKEQQVAIAQQKRKASVDCAAFVEHQDDGHQQRQVYKKAQLKDACVQYNDESKSEQLRKQLYKCQLVAQQSRIFYNQMAKTCKQVLGQCKTQVILMIQDFIKMIANTSQEQTNQLQRQHDEKLQTIIAQNWSLKQQLQQLQIKSNPLKQITFNQFNIELPQNLIINQKLQTTSHKPLQEQLNSIAVQPKLQSFPIKTRRNKHSKQSIDYQPIHRPQYHPQTRIAFDQKIVIPSIRPITIGVPPVRQGFGILKYGNRTIYKGMWSNGKFEGKGTLEWDNYSYVGQFKQGVFSGYGILQTQGMVYTGRFQNNKAEGEGTLQLHTTKKCGLWSGNELIREY